MKVCLRISDDILGLHYFFCQSSYGQELGKYQRYMAFKPDDMDPLEWEETLGADVNNRDHALVNFHLAENFVDKCNSPGKSCLVPHQAVFSIDEKKLLLLASIIHDWGEVIKGDIPLALKTENDRFEETRIACVLCDEIISQFRNGSMRSIAKTVMERVVMNRRTKLGKAFYAIERIGYLRTALKAGYYGLNRGNDRKINYYSITASVFGRNLPELISYSSVYPAVRSYLTEKKDTISYLFKSISPFRKEFLMNPKRKFAQSWKKWKKFEVQE